MFDLHQLAAAALALLVLMCHYHLAMEQSKGVSRTESPEWLKHTVSKLAGMGMGLGGVGRLLLHANGQMIVKTQTRLDSVWEKYVATHLNCRLVQGCCNLGCIDLRGANESALVKKAARSLCSGGKKARYCSVECQRAAWLIGDHKTVCRK